MAVTGVLLSTPMRPRTHAGCDSGPRHTRVLSRRAVGRHLVFVTEFHGRTRSWTPVSTCSATTSRPRSASVSPTRPW
ncbi:hypothetical protein ACFPM0_13840 [Pseudonocardia sulfidoxydans]|uniref:hypothetical protein n=1 Tax=Pseudonocardia sulfidoxydans TaxID=54011 RepID=UPI00360934A5